MKSLLQKPFKLFWSLALITLFTGFLLKNKSMDFIYLGSTISISYWIIFIFSTLFFVMIGLNYFALKLVNKSPKKGLTLTHIILQFLALLIFSFYIFQTEAANTNFHNDFLNLTLVLAISLFLLATFFHLINFFLSLLSKTE